MWSRFAPLLLLLASCAATSAREVAALTSLEASVQELPRGGVQEDDEVWTPKAPEPTKSDWIRLKSGEWLKGEIIVLRDGNLDFDSDELDELSLDWEDIKELRAPGMNTLLFNGHVVVLGSVVVTEKEVVVTTEDGEVQRFKRGELQTLLHGRPSRRNYWRGKLSIGGSWRSGNTNQTDVNGIFNATRRTVDSRADFNYNGAYSVIEDVETANNHRFSGSYNYYLNPRFFVTAFSLELFSDPFQNVALRATPAAGVGYTVIDRGKLDWDVGGGLGYQWTKSETVEEGQDRTSGTTAIIVNTGLKWDMTEKIEMSLSYDNQIGFPDTANTNSYFLTELDIELLGPLDLNLAFTWWRTGDPQPDSSGVTPEQNDFRFTIGLALDF